MCQQLIVILGEAHLPARRCNLPCRLRWQRVQRSERPLGGKAYRCFWFAPLDGRIAACCGHGANDQTEANEVDGGHINAKNSALIGLSI